MCCNSWLGPVPGMWQRRQRLDDLTDLSHMLVRSAGLQVTDRVRLLYAPDEDEIALFLSESGLESQ